ncbi:hypothetical protein LINPERPRIM_LOCUS16765, partial [Linum perenne]
RSQASLKPRLLLQLRQRHLPSLHRLPNRHRVPLYLPLSQHPPLNPLGLVSNGHSHQVRHGCLHGRARWNQNCSLKHHSCRPGLLPQI